MASMPKFSNFIKPSASKPSFTPSSIPSPAPALRDDVKTAEEDRRSRESKDSSPTRREKHKSKHKHKKHKRGYSDDEELELLPEFDDTSRPGSSSKSLAKFESTLEDSSLFSIRRTGDKRLQRRGGISKQDLPDYNTSFKGILGISRLPSRSQSLNSYELHQESSEASRKSKKRAFEGRYCEKGAVFTSSLPVRKKTASELQIEHERYGPFAIPVDLVGEKTETAASALLEEQQSMETRYLERNRELNALLLNDPHNIYNWLQMVHLQDEFSALATGSYRKQNKGARSDSLKVVVDTKLEIFKRGLEQNPGNITLLIGMLETMEGLENPLEASKAWHKAVSENPDSGPLWLAYLSFIQSHFSSFSIERIRIVCTSAVRYLNRAKAKIGIELEEFIADILVKAILIEHQAGYTERAIGIYQALVEINFAAPESIQRQFSKLEANSSNEAQQKFASARNSLLASFQAFWESPIPRFGEAGATGWNTAYLEHDFLKPSIILYDPLAADQYEIQDYELQDLSGGAHGDGKLEKLSSEFEEGDEPNSMDVDDNIGSSHVSSLSEQLHRWVETECSSERNSVLPLRADQAGEDVDAVVLFEDIKDLLVYFSNERIKMLILTSFLDLLGVFLPKHVSTNARLYQVKDLEEEHLEHVFDYLDSIKFPQMASTHTSLATDPEIPTKPHIIFPRFYDMLDFHISPILRKSPTYTALARQVLLHASQMDLDAKTTTQFKIARILLDGTEAAKQLLQLEPDNIALWNGFLSSLVPTDGNAKALQFARRSMTKSISSFLQHPHVTQTLRIASMMEIDAGDQERARNILLSISDASSVPISAEKPIPNGSRISRAIIDYDMKLNSFHLGISTLIGSLSASPNSSDLFELYDSLEVYFNLTICSATLCALNTGVQAMETVYNTTRTHLEQISLDFPYLSTSAASYIERLWMYELRYMCVEYQRMSQHVSFGVLQSRLKVFLENFPTNRYALSILVVLSQRSQLIASSRVYFDTELFGFKRSDQHQYHSRLLLWLFAARSEVRMGASGRIRSLLERSLMRERIEDSHIHQSILIWKLQLELAFGSKIQVGFAKGLLYRAIRCCPWAKSLWMGFLDRLGPYLRPDEIGDLLALLAEKEIRLRSIPDFG